MKLLNTTIAATFIVSIITLLAVIRMTQNTDSQPEAEDGLLYSFCASQVYYSTIADGNVIHSEDFEQYINYNQLNGKDILVMYIPEYSCDSCVKAVINTINEYIHVKNNVNVLFLIADSKVDNPEIGDNLLKIKNGIGIGIDSIQLPVVFIYNEQVKHLLIPDVGLKIALEYWLEAVSERYSLQN